jgi:hypothetical protein
VVTATPHVFNTEARTGDDATGTLGTRQAEYIPSIISIRGASITLTTLTLLELEEIFDISFPDSLLNATTFRSAKSLENAIQMLRKERDGHGTGH